ncbi:MAG TPA: glycosyltransferase 87 family protein [Thermoleophilaceae bacterium]
MDGAEISPGTGAAGGRGAVARRLAGLAALAAMGAASLAIVAGAQSGLDVLVPAAKLRYPDWLHGPLKPLELELSNDGLAWLLLALCVAYLAALACARAIPPRAGLTAIAGLHLLYVLAPPLLSSDVFGYIDLGRLGAVHGIDPYSPTDTPLPDDEVYAYRRWGSDLPSPYGPLFVLAMYPLGALGVPAALWSLKVLLGAASFATVLLVRRCAERVGQDPHRAALFVGLNPVLLLWGVGGAHNDFLFVLALTAAIALSLDGRERVGAAAIAVGAAVKASAGLPLLFLVAGARERGQALKGAAIAGAAMLALAAAFGSDVVRLLEAIRDQQDAVALFSFPNQLGEWLGLGGLTGGIRAVSVAVLLAALALTLVAAGLRRLTWFAAAGWATAALLVTSAWLLPWYLVWLLPLAALSADRRLEAAAIAIGGFVVYTRVDLWFGLA